MKKFLALFLVLSMLFCFAACDGKDSDDKKDTSDNKNYVKTEENDIEESESEEENNNQNPKRTITVGYTIYEPMNYKDASGELVGFDTELAKKVFENLGYNVVFQEIEWTDKYVELESGAIDCIWNGFTANTTDDDGVLRSEKVDFSYSYMDNTQAVVVRVDSGIASYDDLYGKTAVAETDSIGESYAAYVYDADCKTVADRANCLIEVRCGAADFAVVDLAFAKENVGVGDYSGLKIVPSLTSEPEYYAIGFKKGSDLTAQVNEQLEELAADGTIAEIAKKYGLEYTVITDFSDQK